MSRLANCSQKPFHACTLAHAVKAGLVAISGVTAFSTLSLGVASAFFKSVPEGFDSEASSLAFVSLLEESANTCFGNTSNALMSSYSVGSVF